MAGSDAVLTLVGSMVRRLPPGDVTVLCSVAVQGIPAVQSVRTNSSSATLRSYCDRLVALMVDTDPQYIAGALAAASHMLQISPAEAVDVVWTGPHPGGVTGR